MERTEKKVLEFHIRSKGCIEKNYAYAYLKVKALEIIA